MREVAPFAYFALSNTCLSAQQDRLPSLWCIICDGEAKDAGVGDHVSSRGHCDNMRQSNKRAN